MVRKWMSGRWRSPSIAILELYSRFWPIYAGDCGRWWRRMRLLMLWTIRQCPLRWHGVTNASRGRWDFSRQCSFCGGRSLWPLPCTSCSSPGPSQSTSPLLRLRLLRKRGRPRLRHQPHLVLELRPASKISSQSREETGLEPLPTAKTYLVWRTPQGQYVVGMVWRKPNKSITNRSREPPIYL